MEICFKLKQNTSFKKRHPVSCLIHFLLETFIETDFFPPK